MENWKKDFDSFKRAVASSFPIKPEHYFEGSIPQNTLDLMAQALKASCPDNAIWQIVIQAEEIQRQRLQAFETLENVLGVLIEAMANYPLPKEEESERYLFLNHYRCPKCGTEWNDEWYCIVDDECPKCGMRHITPYSSEDLVEVAA